MSINILPRKIEREPYKYFQPKWINHLSNAGSDIEKFFTEPIIFGIFPPFIMPMVVIPLLIGITLLLVGLYIPGLMIGLAAASIIIVPVGILAAHTIAPLAKSVANIVPLIGNGFYNAKCSVKDKINEISLNSKVDKGIKEAFSNYVSNLKMDPAKMSFSTFTLKDDKSTNNPDKEREYFAANESVFSNYQLYKKLSKEERKPLKDLNNIDQNNKVDINKDDDSHIIKTKTISLNDSGIHATKVKIYKLKTPLSQEDKGDIYLGQFTAKALKERSEKSVSFLIS